MLLLLPYDRVTVIDGLPGEDPEALNREVGGGQTPIDFVID
jgi:hypothetical protein